MFNKYYINKDGYGWAISDDFIGKAKIVYEFETFFNQSAYIYPIQALYFRALGAQAANMWTYTFNEIDYLSDFYEKSKALKHTNYPILTRKNECKGLLTLTDTNNVNKKQVILVDHNNFSQSVDGLEEAEIIEIFDHHNLGTIGTSMPINFRCMPVGCTCTIIYKLYKYPYNYRS